MTTDAVLPVISLNGSSPESLMELRKDALLNLRAAYRALVDMDPHYRDYFQKDGLLKQAQEIHAVRRQKILEVFHELNIETELLQDKIDEYNKARGNIT